MEWSKGEIFVRRWIAGLLVLALSLGILSTAVLAAPQQVQSSVSEQEKSSLTGDSVKVPILTYHHLVTEAKKETDMTVALFQAQMQALLAAGYTTVSLQELVAYVQDGVPLPEKPIVLTFDDGYLSNYELAYPILQKYQMKATIFVIGVSVGKDTYKDTDQPIIPHFSYAQAAEMVDSGLISIQSHTWDMHQTASMEPEGSVVRPNMKPLPGETEAEYTDLLTADFTMSRDAIEAATGQPVMALAYPLGGYTQLTEQILHRLGVQVTLCSTTGLNTVTVGKPESLYLLKRYSMDGTISPQMLCRMISADNLPASGFSDVAMSAWYAGAVCYMADRGLMSGTGNGKFSPDASLNRAMLVTILYRYAQKPPVEGSSSFTDVPDGQWYSDAVAWAQQEGIVAGTSATTFSPLQPVTREQMATILFRYAALCELDTSARDSLQGFADTDAISDYALEAIQWCAAVGILSGSGGVLKPKDSATRAQFASILMRYIELAAASV